MTAINHAARWEQWKYVSKPVVNFSGCAPAVGPGFAPVADGLIPLVLLCSGAHTQASLQHRGADVV